VVLDDQDRDRDGGDAAGRARGARSGHTGFRARPPALRQVRPAGWARRITARHLLSCSAGLANPVPVRWVHPAGQPAPDPEVFLGGLLARHGKLRFEPGSRASYPNAGPLVLAAALASAAGQPFTELAGEQTLGPLGMGGTAFTVTSQMRPHAADGYHPRLSPMRLLLPRWVIGGPAGRWVTLRPFEVDGPAYGGLVGPVQELARFLQMHLRDGELGETRILSPQATAAMRQITVQGRRYDLGLGWFRPASQRNADPPFVEHLGGGAGFFTRAGPPATAGGPSAGSSWRARRINQLCAAAIAEDQPQRTVQIGGYRAAACGG
jgi:CubicO group peptidase (beta-lactamase class C family)